MTNPEILAAINAIKECRAEDIPDLASALEARKVEHKSQLMAQCKAVGIHCEDTNGKKRGRRANAKDADAN